MYIFIPLPMCSMDDSLINGTQHTQLSTIIISTTSFRPWFQIYEHCLQKTMPISRRITYRIIVPDAVVIKFIDD